MASFRDILGYYRAYWTTSVLTVVASSGFELLDLVVPYALGQILNTLSGQPLDGIIAGFIARVSNLTGVPEGTNLSLGVLLGLVFVSTVIRAPLQPWLGDWFHWDIALRSRRDHSQRVVEKILTLPLSFYDENNPGRIAGRVARGLSNHTWTYPDVAGDLIPKLVRIVGIFVVIWFVSRPIAIAFLASFIIILGFSLKKLSRLVRKETVIDRYIENTESRTSEIVTNIKTVKAFAAEANELQRQRLRMQRELDVIIYRIHRGYTTLVTWQRLMVQTCMFLVLVFTLRATLQGNITIGNFVTTLTVASIAYAELSPIGQLADRYLPSL
ncbi:MAG: ABC transporter ATP-binding protein, partial [Coleofasciculaceae cyanobacterium SM2_3_26]|nr:ABC transporter ATP-binding protein [Coleofasciculaceae cyanobacterium SM2_3_26]